MTKRKGRGQYVPGSTNPKRVHESAQVLGSRGGRKAKHRKGKHKKKR